MHWHPRSLREGVAARLDAGGNYSRWVLLVTLTGLFATIFPITVLTLAIPGIAEDFGVDEGAMTWVITLPTLASALTLPILGKLGDLYGHRRVFLIGFAVATATTALTATAGSAVALIAWRTVTQVTGGATQPSSLALINSEYPPAGRAKAMGWWAMVAAGAPVVGLVVGAPLIDEYGWQVLFLVQAVLMVLPVVASWAVLRETPRRTAQFDLRGALMLAVGVGSFMVAVSQGPAWGLTNPVVLACIVVTPLSLYAFVLVERRAPTPLIPLEFFGRRDFSATVTASFFTSASYMGGFVIASLLLVQQFGYTAREAMPILVIRPIVFAAFSPVGGWLAGRRGTRIGTLAGAVALVIGLSGLAIGSAASSIALVIGVGFIFQGIGYGLLRPAISTALANTVAEADLGIAGASERLMGQIGVAFGITVMTTVYARGAADADNFATSFAVGAVLAVVGAGLALLMRRGRPGELGPPGAGPDRGVEVPGSATDSQIADLALEEMAREETGGGVVLAPPVSHPSSPGR